MRIILFGCLGRQLSAELTELGHEVITASKAADVLTIALFFGPHVIWLEEPTADATTQKLAAHLRRDVRLDGVTIAKHSESSWEWDRLSDSPIDLCMSRESFVDSCRMLL